MKRCKLTSLPNTFPLLSSCVAVLLVALLPSSVAATDVVFHFDPPDGVIFVETQRITKTIKISGGDETMPPPQISQQQLRYRVQKTPEGYSVITSPIAPDDKLADDVATMMANLIRNMVITYDLDKNGQLVGVRGVKEAMDKLSETLPPELTGLIQLMMPQSIEQQVAQQWRMRSVLGLHAGKTMELNKDYPLSGSLPTSAGGGMQLKGSLKAARAKGCPDSSCIAVSYRYASDDQTMGQQLSSMIRQAMLWMVQLVPPDEGAKLLPQLPTIVVKDTELTEHGQRTLSATTGLIYGQEIQRDITATVVFQGSDERQFHMTESHVDSYDYQ